MTDSVGYLNSGDVKVFPSSFRGVDAEGNPYDPEASLTTESSLRRLSVARFSHRSTVFGDPSTNELVICISGYVFTIPPADGVSGEQAMFGRISALFPNTDGQSAVTDVYAAIRVASLAALIGQSSCDFDQLQAIDHADENDRGEALDSAEGKFEGLAFYGEIPEGITDYVHVMHRDGDSSPWEIPESSGFVTDAKQVENNYGEVSIGSRLDTKKVVVTDSGNPIDSASLAEDTSGFRATVGSDSVTITYEKPDSSGVAGDSSVLMKLDSDASEPPEASIGFSVGGFEASIAKGVDALAISDGKAIDILSPDIDIGPDGSDSPLGTVRVHADSEVNGTLKVGVKDGALTQTSGAAFSAFAHGLTSKVLDLFDDNLNLTFNDVYGCLESDADDVRYSFDAAVLFLRSPAHDDDYPDDYILLEGNPTKVNIIHGLYEVWHVVISPIKGEDGTTSFDMYANLAYESIFSAPSNLSYIGHQVVDSNGCPRIGFCSATGLAGATRLQDALRNSSSGNSLIFHYSIPTATVNGWFNEEAN